jgi:hypothetical protein
MKQLTLMILIYLCFGLTTFNEQPYTSGSFTMSIPNKREMEKEVMKLDESLVKASILNYEVDTALQTLDSLNNALDSPKEVRKYKRELKKLNALNVH